MNIIIDGLAIKNKEILYIELNKQIKSDEFFGDNLDALYDYLSYVDKDVNIKVINKLELIDNLGNYSNGLLGVFEDLQSEKKSIKVEYI